TTGNLIANGDFTNGLANWHTEYPMNAGNVNATGAFCVANAPNGLLFGWSLPASSPLVLPPQTAYHLAYQASGSGMMNVKVGLAVSPYTPDFQTQPNDDAVGSTMQTFTHDFSTATGDANTGLAFTVGSASGTTTVCIDNVTLTKN